MNTHERRLRLPPNDRALSWSTAPGPESVENLNIGIQVLQTRKSQINQKVVNSCLIRLFIFKLNLIILFYLP